MPHSNNVWVRKGKGTTEDPGRVCCYHRWDMNLKIVLLPIAITHTSQMVFNINYDNPSKRKEIILIAISDNLSKKNRCHWSFFSLYLGQVSFSIISPSNILLIESSGNSLSFLWIMVPKWNHSCEWQDLYTVHLIRLLWQMRQLHYFGQ